MRRGWALLALGAVLILAAPTASSHGAPTSSIRVIAWRDARITGRGPDSVKVAAVASAGPRIWAAASTLRHGSRVGEVWESANGQWVQSRWPSTEIPSEIAFGTATGWAETTSGRFLLASNAFASWRSISTMPRLAARRLPPQSWATYTLQFVSGQIGWALGIGPSAAFQAGKGLFETTDGGATWTCVAASESGVGATNAGPMCGKSTGLPADGTTPRFHMISSSDGWLALDTAGGPGYLLWTTDAGRTWAPVHIEGLPGALASGGVVWIALSWQGARAIGLIAGERRAYVVENERGWHVADVIPAAWGRPVSAAASVSGLCAVLLDAPNTQTLLTTRSAGVGWYAYRLGLSHHFSSIVVHGGKLFMLAGGVLWASADGGRTWRFAGPR